MGKFSSFFKGLVEPNDPYAQDDDMDYGDSYGDADPYSEGDPYADDNAYSAPPPRAAASAAQPQHHPAGGMGVSAGSIEMKVVKAEKYDSQTAQMVADHLINNRTVSLNLEEINKESARRLIDFLCGIVYAIDGSIQRVANNVVIIAPKSVSVSGEQLQEAKKQDEVSDLF